MPRKSSVMGGPALFEADPPQASDAGAPAAPAPTPSTALHVARLRVRGYAGFDAEEAFDFAPGVNLITGSNGSRKSSILAAIRCALGMDRVTAMRRAHVHGDGSMAVPEIEITLRSADGTREAAVIRAGEGSPGVSLRTGDQWSKPLRPADWLRDLVGTGAIPEQFVMAKDDDRAAMLLEALDLPGYSRTEALARAGVPTFALPPIPEGLHPLEDLVMVQRAIFDSRTVVNKERRAEEDAAGKLLDGLPAKAPEDHAGQVGALETETGLLALDLAKAEAEADSRERAAIAEAKGAYAAAAAEAEAKADREAERIETSHEARSAEIRAEAERQIAALAEGARAAAEEVRSGQRGALGAANEHLVEASAVAARFRAKAREEHEADRATLSERREQLAALREQQRSADLDRRTRAAAQDGKAKAAVLAEKSEALTTALDALRRYATELAGTLPIQGLEVGFDERGRRLITLDGIELGQINDGRLQEIADEVSLMRTAARGTDRPHMKLILIDWMEQIDDERRAVHLRSLADRGAQVVAAVVTTGDLKLLRGEDALAGAA